MSDDTPYSPSTPHHVKLRWWQRNPERNVDVITAWRRSIEIEAPNYHYDTARLHSPSDTILLCRNGTLKTVLYAEGVKIEEVTEEVEVEGRYETKTETTSLVECPHCENKHEEDKNCHWCDQTIEGVEKSPNQMENNRQQTV